MRIADTQDSFDLEIERDETQRETLKQKCMDFEQKIQQARTDHSNAFFLAFSKKKALLALIDDLTKQRAQCSQQISDLDRKIEEAGRNKAKEVEKIQQAHDDLRMEMEQAKARVEQLPAEISEAEKDLADAQERLKKIPEMSLKELNARPRKPAPAPASKPKNDAQPTVKTEEQKLEDKILNVLSGAYKMTVSEIMSSDPELSPMKISAQRVSALLRQMTMKGLIVREEEMRKAYFRLP
jgi:chromosome segregation ATPase